jgi:hypothetical protein
MNIGRCLACGDPLGMSSRADRRTCSDLCRKRVSLAGRAERPVPAAKRARRAAIGAPKGHRASRGSKCETSGLQP